MDKVTYSRIVQRGYDTLADAYTDRRPVSDLEDRILTEFCARLPNSGVVLDAGCGGETPTTEALSEHLDVVGVDISRAQIELATNRHPTEAFVRGDMHQLPLQHSTVDGICAFYSLIHAVDHQAVLDEFARVLEPGGYLLLTTGVSGETSIDTDWFGSGERMLLNVPGRDESLRLLENAGFDNLTEYTHSPDPDPHDPFYLLARRKS